MKKTFNLVDEKRRIVQVTTDDERFYIRESTDPATGNPTHIWLPSSSWIASFCPKGIEFYKWLANTGWDEAEALKTDRGKYGTRVHKAIELLLNGNTIAMDEELPTADGSMMALTAEEYLAVTQFAAWWQELVAEHEVEIVLTEYTIWCVEHGFAGTTDLVLKVDGVYWIIDFKTSQSVHLYHIAQLSSYKHGLLLDADLAITGEPQLFILQIGYKRNKNGYKLNAVDDCFHLWQAAKLFWQDAHAKTTPHQVQMPLSVTLTKGVKKNMSKQTSSKTTSKKTSKKTTSHEPK